MVKKYLHKRANSFYYAFKGILTLVRTQPNAKIHLVATLAVTAAGFIFEISLMEWIAVCICISTVWFTEAINTALEFLTDLVSPEYNELAGKVKDVAAAAVLIAAIVSVIIASIIFLPKMF